MEERLIKYKQSLPKRHLKKLSVLICIIFSLLSCDKTHFSSEEARRDSLPPQSSKTPDTVPNNTSQASEGVVSTEPPSAGASSNPPPEVKITLQQPSPSLKLGDSGSKFSDGSELPMAFELKQSDSQLKGTKDSSPALALNLKKSEPDKDREEVSFAFSLQSEEAELYGIQREETVFSSPLNEMNPSLFDEETLPMALELKKAGFYGDREEVSFVFPLQPEDTELYGIQREEAVFSSPLNEMNPSLSEGETLLMALELKKAELYGDREEVPFGFPLQPEDTEFYEIQREEAVFSSPLNEMNPSLFDGETLPMALELREAELQENSEDASFAIPLIEQKSAFSEFNLKPVYFDINEVNFSEAARHILNANAQFLKDRPYLTLIRLEGHCDSIGTDEYNYGLGLRRAENVKQYLMFQGISEERLEIESYGKSRRVSRKYPEKNRRVSFVLCGDSTCEEE